MNSTKALWLGILMWHSTPARGQCYLPSDTIVSAECTYIPVDPHIMIGMPVTKCYTLISESDNVTPGFVFVQSDGCGPIAYGSLSYAVYSEDCSQVIGSGNIVPFSFNPTTILPDTSANYVLCFTWLPQCEQTAYCGTMDFSPLPVEMLTFGGYETDGGLMLQWTTGSESNSSHFILRSSTDMAEWRKVGVAVAAGHSYTERGYEMVDKKAVQGVNYYRLTEVDFDGEQQHANVIAVICTKPNEFLYYNILGQDIKPYRQ